MMPGLVAARILLAVTGRILCCITAVSALRIRGDPLFISEGVHISLCRR